MANPQQPEVRRSENNPALSPDAMKAKLEAQEDGILKQEATPDAVKKQMAEQSTSPDQDQPDLDAVADSLGVTEA